jgi:hypothetical protein
MRRIIAVSDLQCPYQSKRAVRALERYVASLGPDDQVICVGDELDQPATSRWHRGLKGEFMGQLDAHRNITVDVLGRLKVQHICRSNHSDRLESYVAHFAPALASLPELRYEAFMRFADLGITYHRKPFKFARNWVLLHGDEGRMSQVAGQTALNLAIARNTSVLCGHSHRAGLSHKTYSMAGNVTKQIWGLEVGTLMNPRSIGAAYTGGTTTWAQSFGILHVDDNGNVKAARPVMIEKNGSFFADGRVWEA